jgi:hypothetical protein
MTINWLLFTTFLNAAKKKKPAIHQALGFRGPDANTLQFQKNQDIKLTMN